MVLCKFPRVLINRYFDCKIKIYRREEKTQPNPLIKRIRHWSGDRLILGKINEWKRTYLEFLQKYMLKNVSDKLLSSKSNFESIASNKILYLFTCKEQWFEQNMTDNKRKQKQQQSSSSANPRQKSHKNHEEKFWCASSTREYFLHFTNLKTCKFSKTRRTFSKCLIQTIRWLFIFSQILIQRNSSGEGN
jgi:hypothetical protein